MKLVGKIIKTKGKPPWIVEVQSLDLVTQGRTKTEALEMLVDAVTSLIDDSKFIASVSSEGDEVLLSCNDPGALLALMLQRQRAAVNITLADAAKKMHSASKNAYRQYETGDRSPTIDKLNELLFAIDKDFIIQIQDQDDDETEEDEKKLA